MKAMAHSAFGDPQKGIVPPPSLPTIHPVQFQQAQTGASWDNIHYGERSDPDHVINEGGSGAV